MHPIAVCWAPVPPFTAIASRTFELLDTEERARAARFVHQCDRAAFIAAHALTRTMLGRELGVDAERVCLTNTAGRRPEIAGRPGGAPAFSVTHTRALAACAVGPRLPLGIDAETVPMAAPENAVLQRCCTPSEQALLAALPEGLRSAAFTRLWTMKEAVLKALGVGLAVAPTEVEGRLQPAGIVKAPPAGTPGRWHVWLYEPRPGELLTVAAHGADIGPPVVREQRLA